MPPTQPRDLAPLITRHQTTPIQSSESTGFLSSVTSFLSGTNASRPRALSLLLTGREKEANLFFLGSPGILSGKSNLMTWVLLLNAVVGSGVLGIPYAFHMAGIGLSVSFLALLTVMAFMTANYLLETQSRTQALINLVIAKHATDQRTAAPSSPKSPGPKSPLKPSPTSSFSDPYQWTKREAIHEAKKEISALPTSPRHTPPGTPQNKSSPALMLPPLPREFRILDDTRIFEVNEMCSVFLGKWGQTTWEASILLEVYACLWLYSVMMATTLLEVVPIPGLSAGQECKASSPILSESCEWAYRVWLIVIALVMVPNCLRDLKDLGVVQMALTWIGYSCIAAMMLTVGWALFNHPLEGVPASTTAPYIADQSLFLPAGFGLLFSTTIFTQMCHIAVPSLTQVIKDKQDIQKVLLGGMTTTFLLYSLLGVVTNLYFGPKVSAVITLNWKTFAWSGSLGLGTRAINLMVVLLPFFTVANAFPMNAHALANNVISAVSPSTWKGLLAIGDEETGLITEVWPPRRVKLVARLLCSVPPFMLAAGERNPATIVSIIGIFGFLLMFFMPCLLQYQSQKLFKDIWPNAKGIHRTPYATFLSEKSGTLTIAGLSSLGFVVLVYNVICALFSL